MHAVQWFEFPAADLDRAFGFYNQIMPQSVRMGTFGDQPLVLFNVDLNQGAIGGSLVLRPDFSPSATGPLIYLHCNEPLSTVVNRIAPAGGKVLLPQLPLGKFGFAAIFIDSEGNRVGILSAQA